MSKHKELLIRVYITVLVVIMVALGLSYRVVKINVIEGDRWRMKGDSLYVKFVPVKAERGDILGRNGELLATSQPLFDIRMDTRANGLTEKAFREGVDSLSYFLSKYGNTQWSANKYRNYLIGQRAKGNRYVLIKRNANYDELERFKRFPIFRRGQHKGGLIVERKDLRSMRYGYLAKRTIGSVRENVQPVGLEGYFDAEMRGSDGKRLMQRVKNAWIPVLQSESVPATRGADVHTTLDMRMQDIVESNLMKAMVTHDGEYGTAVLMDVKTGAILAIANLDRASGGGYYEGYNHAVGSATEPGSTFKLASVMALLEDGFATLDSRVDLHNGKKRFYGHDMYDSSPHPHRDVDLRHAFEISSNVGIATLVDDAYGRTQKGKEFIARINQFGLNRTTGITLIGEQAPYIKEAYNTDQNWSATTIPWMSHGYECKLTPLQTLAFYNAVANGGKMVRPYLVTSVEKDGKIIKKYKPEVVIDRIAKPATIERAQELLEGVVLRGTGENGQSPYVSIAGKTGTAVIDYFRSDQGRKKYQGSFAGYFPVEDPKYSLIVLMSDPRKNGIYGGAVALPAFKAIAEGVMALEEVDWQPPVNKEPDSAQTEDFEVSLASVAYKPDLNVIADMLDVKYKSTAETDWVSWKMKSGDHLQPVEMPESKMPDVRNMGLRDAVYLLENQGLRVDVRGVGKVRRQSIRKGENVSKGTRVILDLG